MRSNFRTHVGQQKAIVDPRQTAVTDSSAPSASTIGQTVLTAFVPGRLPDAGAGVQCSSEPSSAVRTIVSFDAQPTRMAAISRKTPERVLDTAGMVPRRGSAGGRLVGEPFLPCVATGNRVRLDLRKWPMYRCHMASFPIAASSREVMRLLGLRLAGGRTKGSAPRAGTLADAVRGGLQLGAIDSLARSVSLPPARIIEALRIPPRTLARRRASKHLSAEESDRLSRMARTASTALAVFDDGARTGAWLITPNRALGGSTPLSLLDTDAGAALVDEVLARIQHGIAS